MTNEHFRFCVLRRFSTYITFKETFSKSTLKFLFLFPSHYWRGQNLQVERAFRQTITFDAT